MKALVAGASRHGSTQEIAQIIAGELRAAAIDVDVRTAHDVAAIAAYDAVILGSAIYMGQWLPEARQFVTRHQARLATVPVWLFSSGPLGTEHPQPAGDPAGLAAMMEATHACEHRVFVGKLDSHHLGIGERLMVKVVGAPYGDFRDWATIRDWAHQIATALGSGSLKAAEPSRH